MYTILTVVQVFLSLGLIGLVLIQHGKGADAGAAFGSGASQTVFGSQGTGSFLTRTTAIVATLFFLTSMALAYYATQSNESAGLMDRLDDVAVKNVSPAVKSEAPIPASDIPTISGSSVLDQNKVQADVLALPATVDSTAEIKLESNFNEIPTQKKEN